VEGEAGDFQVALTRKPRYIHEDKCTGCAVCVEYCPALYPDQFNQEISENKAVHIYYSQAIPLVAYIDDSCLFLKENKCNICSAVCGNNAIDFSQTETGMTVRVGAILLAPGFEPFKPGRTDQYGYGRRPNVVTSMDYERLMCATGPYEGKILRDSDKTHPGNVAWIQCIGSRQVDQKLEGGNSYCSSVCCTYTQKQVILTKDHDPDTRCTVFHNDIRAFGKDFEPFYQRTENLSDVRFIKSYVSVVKEDPDTRNITLRYFTPEDGVKEEEFDMVVLSVGLNPPAGAKDLAQAFGIELNRHDFCRISPDTPMQTTRPGIYISGAFGGPADIPESVFGASAAGSKIGEFLNKRRGKLSLERTYPPEEDVSDQNPRIGVFVCHCGANIGRVVDVPSSVEFSLTLPHVVYAQEQLFSCATNCAQEIIDSIKEHRLNRVVLAACSPRTLDALFRDTVREGGLNPYYFEFANIREQCSWVHAKEQEKATRKAKELIRMSVARAAHLEPLPEFDVPIIKQAMVVGGGIAGMTCALSIAAQGHPVYLMEREKDLGGMARRIPYTLDGMDVQSHVTDLIQKIYRHPMVHVYTEAVIDETSGYVGNFVTRGRSERGPFRIEHGATVIATGAGQYQPTEYLYGENDRVMTLLELEAKLAEKDQTVCRADRLVIIQCVGCRNEQNNYCSRVCCQASVKNALALKEINPDMDIFILYRDMRTYGFSEDYYRSAREKQVRFIRYSPDQAPAVRAENNGGRLSVSVTDQLLKQEIRIEADALALAAAVVPSTQAADISQTFGVPLSPSGFFKEAHVKLRPVEFASDGLYLCGTAHYPKLIPETISHANGAAGRVLTMLSHDTVTVPGSVCEVDEKKCIGCGVCVTACTYGAVELATVKRKDKAKVFPVLCKGCGLCNMKCPTGAIQLKHFTDEQITSQIDAAV